MIQLKKIQKKFGDKKILSEVTWQIGKKGRIGLCGPNGAGKTTLLKILAGEIAVDGGDIQIARNATIGYLPQVLAGYGKGPLFEEVRSALGELTHMETELADLEKRISLVSEAGSLERYSCLQETFRLRGGYSMEADVACVLDGLGFAKSDWVKDCENFSGGWQMRIALAKLLLQRPNLLLLDEPTNHLDLPTRDWLEGYLVDYPFSVVLVSHDRFFLDQTVNKIVEIWNGAIHEYPGNYSRYLTERKQRIQQIRGAKQRQDDEIQKTQAFINRFRYQANKASQVQSRVKQLGKIERIEIPSIPKKVDFQFPSSSKAGKIVLELFHVRHDYDPLTVFKDVDLTITRGEKIALVGANGAGKSTLMRLISGKEKPGFGERKEGYNLQIGYFAQNQATLLKPTRTVLEEITADSPFEMVPKLRNILGAFLFSSDEVEKKVTVLSGGERNRLALAKLLLLPCNLLLLDEPTNHLDLDSKDVLLEALKKYDGTMIFVSHDRYFVDQLASRVLEIGKEKVVSHLGNYEDFLKDKEKEGYSDHSSLRVECCASKTADAGTVQQKSTQKTDYLEKKTQQKEERRRQKELDMLEEKIMTMEGERTSLEQFLAEPGAFEKNDKFKEAICRYDELKKEVEALYLRWDKIPAS